MIKQKFTIDFLFLDLPEIPKDDDNSQDSNTDRGLEIKSSKKRYQRSARTESRIIMKKNASSILKCWSVCPFRWKTNKFMCSYCDDGFTDCDALRNHVRLCSQTHSITEIFKKFKEMRLVNIDIVDATCNTCAVSFTDLKEMREHVIQHRFEFDSNELDGVLPFSLNKERWNCVICFGIFNNFLKLYEHMNTHYLNYICSSCGKGFMTAMRLRKHSETHISGSFPCKICGKDFNMRSARDGHKAQAHAKGPRYECPLCHERFELYNERMQHLKTAHREKEVVYNCLYCEQAFKTSAKRAWHVRSVHFPVQREYACRYCEWKFKTNYELKRHMVKHTGEKNFHCTVCGAAFLRSRALKTHMKSHEDFKCKWCAAVFKEKSTLHSHLRTNHAVFEFSLPLE